MGFVLLLVAIDIVVAILAYSFFAIPSLLYGRLYPSMYLGRYDLEYAPSITVFVPCKGAGGDFTSRVQAFLRLTGEKTRVFFLVESEQDGAWPIIRDLVAEKQNAGLIVAGLATMCAQKNHNLLAGIEAAGKKDEVYVFLDSVTTFTPEQLHDLVVPLSDPKTTVSAGFRWDILKTRTLGERLRAFMIALQGALMHCPCANATWGGGTAIRRADFEALGVADYWAKTAVDDMTMVRILLDAKRKTVFVPTCVKEMESNVPTVKGAVLWFKRQALYLKFYLKLYWLFTVGLLTVSSINLLGFPFLLVSAMIWPARILKLLATITGVFSLLMMICCQATKRRTDDHHGWLSWFFLSPVYLVLSCCAYLMGAWTKVLYWSDVSYHLDRDGCVQEIVRHPEAIGKSAWPDRWREGGRTQCQKGIIDDDS